MGPGGADESLIQSSCSRSSASSPAPCARRYRSSGWRCCSKISCRPDWVMRPSAYRRGFACSMGWQVSAMDAPRGFEPRLTESESVVLPLDDGAMPVRRGGEIESGVRPVNLRLPDKLD